MRRIDKMSKNEILNFLKRCEDLECETCPAYETITCTTAKCAATYLEQELVQKKDAALGDDKERCGSAGRTRRLRNHVQLARILWHLQV